MVNVGNADKKETIKIIKEIKNAIKSKETLNTIKDLYRSDASPVPINDNIYIPTRNGKGDIQINTVGGDADIRSIVDIDYFRNKFFASIKIPKAFLGFEEEMPGGIGNTSLTRLDIRYARSVKRVQSVLKQGVKDICNYYLVKTGQEQKLDKFEVKMAIVSSAEEADHAQDLSLKLTLVQSMMDTMVTNFEDIIDKEKAFNYFCEKILNIDPDFILKEAKPKGVNKNAKGNKNIARFRANTDGGEEQDVTGEEL